MCKKQNFVAQQIHRRFEPCEISRHLGRMSRHSGVMVYVIMIFLVGVSSASSAKAGELNCPRTENRVEEMICEDDKFLELHLKMEVLYETILYGLEYASDTQAMARIKGEQNSWEKESRNICPEVRCIATAYQERIRQLRKDDCYSVFANRLISEDEVLAKVDFEMYVLFTTVIDALTETDESLAIDRIKAEQRQWLKEVRNSCLDVECLKTSYESRTRRLNAEKDYSFSVSRMTEMLKTCLSVSSPSEAARIKAKHAEWLKELREICHDIACLESAYDSRKSHLKNEAEKDIKQFWDTDGYWYFYNKNGEETIPTTLAYYSADGSDVLLETDIGNAGNIWINAFRFASEDELHNTVKMKTAASFPRKKKLCNGNTGKIIERAGDTLFSVVIKTPKQADEPFCEDCLSFTLIRDLNPPTIIHGLLRETHQDTGPIKLPISSAISNIQVMSDCTIMADISEGMIRFRQDGTTDAKLPPGTRLVDGKMLLQWQNEFYKSYSGEAEMSLEPKLQFIHDKIFGEEKR